MNEGTTESDQEIVKTVGEIAAERGVDQVIIALAWLNNNPVVAAPIVGALKIKHIDDAIASLGVILTDDEMAKLEAPYTPRVDGQGISDPIMLARAVEAATGFKVA